MAEDNHYRVLGVSQTATDEDIKEAYRNLAKKHHPDKNPGDKDAEARFVKIVAAYEILKDKLKRESYDVTLSGGGGYRSQHIRGPFANGPDARGRSNSWGDFRQFNVVQNLFLTLEQVAFGSGSSLHIRYERLVVCPKCHNEEQSTTCDRCDGKGRITEKCESFPDIPPGASEGDNIVINNKGDQDPKSGDFGNLVLRVRLIKHDRFHLNSLYSSYSARDLILFYKVNIIDLITQGDIKIKTLYSEVMVPLSAKIFNSEDGIYHIKGHGLPKWNDRNTRGDLMVLFKLDLPDPTTYSAREKALIKYLSETKNFKKTS